MTGDPGGYAPHPASALRVFREWVKALASARRQPLTGSSAIIDQPATRADGPGRGRRNTTATQVVSKRSGLAPLPGGYQLSSPACCWSLRSSP
jgi:hypothetical protein